MLFTMSHTPEQNGVAERLNRTLLKTTRCFLNDLLTLPKPVWAELIKTACYLKNRMPSSATENFQSSYEMLIHRRPSFDHLRIIGSVCYGSKTGRAIGKLDERAIEFRLVGYESDDIFRVCDPATQKVIRARDLVIKEKIPHPHHDEKSAERQPDKVYFDLNDHNSTPTQSQP